MNSTFLDMIGHGTKGTDGIEEGIHLRWSFDDKLGFPDCFKLYRRKSDRNDRYELPIARFDSDNFQLPKTFHLHQASDFSYTLDFPKRDQPGDNTLTIQTDQLPDGSFSRYLGISGELGVGFSQPVNRIEMAFLLQTVSDFEIQVKSVDGNYEPYTVTASSMINKVIAFDVKEATAVLFRGEGIRLASLAAWITQPRDGWERLNDYCGCGLPVNTDGTPYMDDVYQGMGKDLAMALCRMGFRRVQDSPITAAEFLEFKLMLLTMAGEGTAIPVGWTQFADTDNEDGTSFGMSKYDFVLMQSMQVYFARMIGMFWVDTTAEAGEYYDYKVTAAWPEWNLRRLTHECAFEKFETGYSFSPVVALDDNMVMVAPKSSVVTNFSNDFFRTEKALQFELEQIPVIISFLKPVTEVQIVLVNPGYATGASVRVEAYKNLFENHLDRQELFIEKGILRVRAEKIDTIRVFGSGFMICRIHYEYGSFPKGEQQYIIGGIKKQDHLQAAIPLALAATGIPGGTVNHDDGTTEEQPTLAGLRWLANEDPDANLIPLTPVLYHVERQENEGRKKLLTEDSPLFIATSALDHNRKDSPGGWPEERQFFTEPVPGDSQHSYRIAAIDLFGRESEWTPFVACEPVHAPPPPPENVRAKFLDFSCYDTLTDTFADQTLDNSDKEWLNNHQHNAIRVSWDWPRNLNLQSAGIDGFRVHYKQGWLNNYTGLITTEIIRTTITKSSLAFTQKELKKFALIDQGPENIPVYKFRIALDSYAPPPPHAEPQPGPNERDFLPENIFQLSWLTQGAHQFLILKNSTERQPFIWALQLNDIPLINKTFGIAVTAGSPFFINYNIAEKWIDTNVFHEEPENGTGSYIVYLENPAFPDPAIRAQDLNKVRYAQIGVSAFKDDLEGAVASPATIMAIYRNRPATPSAFLPADGTDINELRGTRANVYGQSSFALRWSKSNQVAGYHVLRVMDETLMKINNTHINGRTQQEYDDFADTYPFEATDIDTIRQIPFEANYRQLHTHYSVLTPGQWQILASLADNENAFTRINDQLITADDPAYQDRITSIPDPVNGSDYVPDPAHTLLYSDNTLNGISSNRFFYRIQAVDSNNLPGFLSLSTPPVRVPVSIPPPAPVIIAVAGGQNSITIKWAKNPGALIHGYLLYRTADKIKATDYRRMELVKTNAADPFTIEVDDVLPTTGWEYTDAEVTALQPYYYAVIAVQINEDNKWLVSKISNLVTATAYDQQPPAPPVWDESVSGWVFLDALGKVYALDDDLSLADHPLPAIRLVWEPANPTDTILISKAAEPSRLNEIVLDFQHGSPFDDKKMFFIDSDVTQNVIYSFSAQARSAALLLSQEKSSLNLIPEM